MSLPNTNRPSECPTLYMGMWNYIFDTWPHERERPRGGEPK